jgi:hypothetical protein
MLFLGLVRQMEPASNDGRAVVRFWANSAGTILCCDRHAADTFGLDAADLVGAAVQQPVHRHRNDQQV